MNPNPKNPTAPPPSPSHQQIAQTAYEIYCARGKGDGHAVDDWAEAERALVSPHHPPHPRNGPVAAS